VEKAIGNHKKNKSVEVLQNFPQRAVYKKSPTVEKREAVNARPVAPYQFQPGYLSI